MVLNPDPPPKKKGRSGEYSTTFLHLHRIFGGTVWLVHLAIALPGLGFLWCTSLQPKHMAPWKPTMEHMVPWKPTTKAYGPMKTYNEAYDHIALRCSCRRYQNRAPLQPSPILSMESKDQTSSIQTTQLQILTLENMQYKNRRITLLFFSQNLALSWKKGG